MRWRLEENTDSYPEDLRKATGAFLNFRKHAVKVISERNRLAAQIIDTPEGAKRAKLEAKKLIADQTVERLKTEAKQLAAVIRDRVTEHQLTEIPQGLHQVYRDLQNHKALIEEATWTRNGIPYRITKATDEAEVAELEAEKLKADEFVERLKTETSELEAAFKEGLTEHRIAEIPPARRDQARALMREEEAEISAAWAVMSFSEVEARTAAVTLSSLERALKRKAEVREPYERAKHRMEEIEAEAEAIEARIAQIQAEYAEKLKRLAKSGD